MKRTSSPAARAVLRSKIRSVGLRSTAPRVAVLAHRQSATTPLSHAEIFDTLADQGSVAVQRKGQCDRCAT